LSVLGIVKGIFLKNTRVFIYASDWRTVWKQAEHGLGVSQVFIIEEYKAPVPSSAMLLESGDRSATFLRGPIMTSPRIAWSETLSGSSPETLEVSSTETSGAASTTIS